MFRKILIANRGEIACRVMRSAAVMGIRTVAVYSDADAGALHVEQADEAVHIGGAAPADSYLQKQRVIDAALRTGAEAIHPGYGFLSENAGFARMCHKAGITFIGPPASAIDAMGSKSAAKKIMEEAGVPLLPGYHEEDQADAVLKAAAESVGYPVLLKAAAGGGGKGMRQVMSASEFDEGLAAARREAQSSFGDQVMLVEKLLIDPRHVEVQVFCDSKGNGVYLFERDCSVQRRHQKIIEEGPAPGMSEALRREMGEAAVKAALAIAYEGAGTVEFLLAEDHSFYFMEMNTRLQVEHPVTEMITGQDLVVWQLLVAAGESLPLAQSELRLGGHAFEARIYAEDPDHDFLPAAGKLEFLQVPKASRHVRVDSGVRQGDDIGVFYDPMIAKLVVWDEDRPRALKRLLQALNEYRIRGVTTNIDFLSALAAHPSFADGEVHTGFIEQHRVMLFTAPKMDVEAWLVMGLCYLLLREQPVAPGVSVQSSPWLANDNWRLNKPRVHSRTLTVDGKEHVVSIQECSLAGKPRCFLSQHGEKAVPVQAELEGNNLTITFDGHRRTVAVYDKTPEITLFSSEGAFDFGVYPAFVLADAEEAGGGFAAPMHGTITEIRAKPGDEVKAGATLVIMEAMKMEHAMRAPGDGVVGEIFYSVGDLVEGGVMLLDFQQTEKSSS